MQREQRTYRFGVFVCDDHSNPLNHAVDVGCANEHLTFVQDCLSEGSLADLDPLNQFIMLEEMEQFEAEQLIYDIYYRTQRKS